MFPVETCGNSCAAKRRRSKKAEPVKESIIRRPDPGGQAEVFMVVIVVGNGIVNPRQLLFAESAFVLYSSFYTKTKFAGFLVFIFIKQFLKVTLAGAGRENVRYAGAQAQY